jgi:hypothetical protein
VLNLNSEATFSGDQAVTTPGRPSQRKGIELSLLTRFFSLDHWWEVLSLQRGVCCEPRSRRSAQAAVASQSAGGS